MSQSSAPPPPPPPPPAAPRTVPVWLWAVPLLSCCLLGFLPPIVVAFKAQTRAAWTWAGVFVALDLAGFVILGSQPEKADNVWTSIGAALVILAAAGGTAYAGVMLSKRVPDERATVTPLSGNPAAVAAALEARHRRSEAVALVARDPALARELRVGRPDLPRQYDDGGLVDVNSAPQAVLARYLGLTEHEAAQIVSARQQLGSFERPDDLLNLVGLAPETFDRIRDRLVLL